MDKFIECTKDKVISIRVNPTNPSIYKLLRAGFGSPKLIDNKLSLTHHIGESYNYFRETVIPRAHIIKLLPFSKRLTTQLKEISLSSVEWAGSFVFIDVMEMGTLKQGDELNVYVGTVSKYMFHSHPKTEYANYFYSDEDMKRYFNDVKKYGSIRKDYLITDRGLLSLQINPLITEYENILIGNKNLIKKSLNVSAD